MNEWLVALLSSIVVVLIGTMIIWFLIQKHKINSLCYRLNKIQTKIEKNDSLRDIVDDIKAIKDKIDEALDEFGCNSLYSKIDELSIQS